MAFVTAEFRAGELEPIDASNIPQLDVDTTTSVIAVVYRFDDTTQEKLRGMFEAPLGLTSGTVTFRAKGKSGTAAASKNVAFEFEHAAVAHDEDLDSATYTTEASGDKATINNQNDLEVHEWTETVSNLGWVAEDQIYFLISRKAASSNNLSGDWYLHTLVIEMPVT